jgi:GTP-binding protein
VSFAGSAASPAQFPRVGIPEAAFLGRSNVGKSSLINALAGQRGLARVSGTPGRTRTINFYRCGAELLLADLPGYGYARVPEAERRAWERLVRAYLEDRETLALGVFIVDARHEPMDGDRTLRAYLDSCGLPYVVAATKADKLGRGELARRVAALRAWLGDGACEVIPVSAETREGTDQLWKALRAAAAAGARREART